MDCNATTPVEPEVAAVVLKYLAEEYGNAASRTHEFGATAKRIVEAARETLARSVSASRDEVVFTSGATESNNIAILGLAAEGKRTRRMHIVTTEIEHKAVLEPIERLRTEGFTVTHVRPNAGGWVDPDDVRRAVTGDTLLVSVMHANNETGILQPIEEIAGALKDSTAYLHVDAAQTFGKEWSALRLARVDLMSVSAHKIYGPKGVGALVVRRRGFERPPLTPIMLGGGHEKGLRPGTLPVELIAGLGQATDLALRHSEDRKGRCRSIRGRLLEVLRPLEAQLNGDQARCMSHVVNLSIPGLDSEAAIVALKSVVAVSNGSACTSHSYKPSHVLLAMELPLERVSEALRWSWCHLTPDVDWDEVVTVLRRIRG